MKIVRSIILFFICILGFVLQVEIFQSQLWNFDMAYYLSMRYEVADENIGAFLENAYNEADNNNVSVFATDIYMETNHNAVLNIYGNSEMIKSDLYRVMGITERTYSSLLSGNTCIKYNRFNDLAQLGNNTKKSLSFIGDEENILNVYEAISEKYNVSYPEYFQATEEDMVVIVWSMVAFFIIVMNCIEVLRRKKEVVVRISLGEGVSGIITKSIIGDVVLHGMVYVIAKTFVFRYFSGEYAGKIAFVIFVIGILISFLPYIAFAFYNIKKAFSNVNDSKAVLYALYILKVIVTALTIFTITTNLSSIHWNVGLDDRIIEQYKDYSYITLGNTASDDEGEELFWDEMYKEQYELLKPVICINLLQDDSEYILVNNNAKGMLQGFDKMMKEVENNADFIIFIDKNKSLEECKNTAMDSLDNFLYNSMDSLDIQVIQYDDRQKFSYMSSNENYGIDTVENPSIIYQNSRKAIYDGHVLERYAGSEILFGVKDEELEKIKIQCSEYISGCNFVVTNVYESYSLQKSFVIKLIHFLSSLCIVVFILDVAIVISISSMEYRTHSMEISLKKVLGYSLFERNKRVILYDLLSDGVILLAMCIIGVFTTILSVDISILTGIFIVIVEMFIMSYNILKVESENIYKVLKGGCL